MRITILILIMASTISCQSLYRNHNQMQLNTNGIVWGKSDYRINNIPVNDSLYNRIKVGDRVKLKTLYLNHRYIKYDKHLKDPLKKEKIEEDKKNPWDFTSKY